MRKIIFLAFIIFLFGGRAIAYDFLIAPVTQQEEARP